MKVYFIQKALKIGLSILEIVINILGHFSKELSRSDLSNVL